MEDRTRILFFSETVSLAHITRPLVLAQTLDIEKYDVHFACSSEFDFVFPEDFKFTKWHINSVSSAQFVESLVSGARVYNKEILSKYINEDINLIKQLNPDVVVGDYRLSLAVSAPFCKVPYIALANAHWSPYIKESHPPLPYSPLIKVMGYRFANFLFKLIRPIIFKYYALPHNQLRVEYQLEALGDLRNVYTYGNYTLYLDVPELIPIKNLPDNHKFIGPVLWSPDIALPSWFRLIDKSKKNIYITLGSSGVSDKLSDIVAILSKLDVNIFVATAGRSELSSGGNVYATDYLPGIKVIRKCDLVVCNGGSATAYQALSEGVPVVGIAANMDQYLTMSYLVRAGVGSLIRSERINNNRLLVDTVLDLLNNAEVKKSVQSMKDSFRRLSSSEQFNNIIDSICK